MFLFVCSELIHIALFICDSPGWDVEDVIRARADLAISSLRLFSASTFQLATGKALVNPHMNGAALGTIG